MNEPEYVSKYKVEVPWKRFLVMCIVTLFGIVPCLFETPVMSLGITWGSLLSCWIIYPIIIATTAIYVYSKEDEEQLKEGE